MGAPFDMSQMAQMLEDPEVKRMIETMQSDPSFVAMTQQLAQTMGGPGGMANLMQGMGAPPGAGAGAGAGAGGAAAGGAADGAAARSADGAGPANAQAAYAQAMQNMLSNPEMASMMENIGKKMMSSDPQMAQMMEAMADPEMQANMQQHMARLKEDPETADIIRELEQGGPAAMSAMWNDPEKLEKMSKAFANMPGGMPFAGLGGAAGGAGGTIDEGDEEEDDDDGEEVDSELIKAAMDGELETVEALIKDGGKDFNIDEQDGTGHSALHYACGYGELEIVKVLLKAKASVTVVDDDKNTPLHYAAGYGQLEACELLMAHGAGLTDKNSDGKTALEVAELNEHADIVKLLKDKEGDAFL